jgi:hypothetical protein
MYTSIFPRLLSSLAGVVLAGVTATCVEQPTDPREAADVPAHRAPPAVVAAAAAVTGIVHTRLTSGNSRVNAKVCTTASIAPAANGLVTVAVLGHNGTAASPRPTISGGGMAAWTQVATVAFDGVATPHKRLTVFRALSSSPGSGPLRITFTTTQSNCEWIVSQWKGIETSGTNGGNAIAQAASARGDNVTGLVVTLGAFAAPGNVAYGVVGVRRSTAGITPGAGFTEIAERPSGETPPSDLQAERSAGDRTIDARWSRANGGALGLEIKAASPSADPVASVEVSPDSASVAVGGSVQLTATPKDAEGQPLSGRTVTWATNAPQVATISGTGLVTGVAPGTATISATSEGIRGTSSVTVTALSQSAVAGEWSSVMPSPIVQLHLHLLANGRVLSWGHGGSPQVWDPATGSFTAAPSPSLLFCTGHTFLPDGRLLVAGGHISNGHGLPNTNIFDPATGSWQAAAPMAAGRWYPTTTTLPNGEVLVLSGQDESGALNAIPEIWNGSAWRQLTTASLSLPNYPRTFVAPDGRVFYAGAAQQSRWLDVTGTGRWSLGPQLKFGARSYGSAVMYLPGKILYVGGGSPPTNTAEVIDLNTPAAQWTYTGSMAYARWNANATLLPTGDVLVTGGTSLADRVNPAGAVNVAELWSPATGQWTQLASAAPLLRGYHSTTVLLPDGRVLHSGGGDGGGVPDNFNYELYSPPYLFKGARPVISGATPADVGYGQTLALATPDGPTIAKVTLIRSGSVTHAFDQAQLLVRLGFSQASGGLSVTLPASRTVAPPGPYLLFVVNADGVPSGGRIMRLR